MRTINLSDLSDLTNQVRVRQTKMQCYVTR